MAVNTKRLTWIKVFGCFALSEVFILGVVFSIPWAQVANVYWTRAFQGLFLLSFLWIVQCILFPKRSLGRELGLKPLFSGESLRSLRYSVPFVISCGLAVIVVQSKDLLLPSWKLYLFENFLHSSISEEVLFRGIVFRLLETAYSTGPAAAYSALLFAGVHLNRVFAAASAGQLIFSLARVAVSFGSGYFMARLYQAYRYNLWVPILFHFFLNGIGMFSASDDLRGILIGLLGITISYAWIYRTVCVQPGVGASAIVDPGMEGQSV